MCTAIFDCMGGYFGRTLDLEYSLSEKVAVTPRHFLDRAVYFEGERLSLVGCAAIRDGTALYYDGLNEAGLSGAALNFPGEACYSDSTGSPHEIPSYALLYECLRVCRSVEDVKRVLSGRIITNSGFSEELPATPLHFMFADVDSAITVEPLAEGLKIFENTVGVMTNSPSFDFQLKNTASYMHLSPSTPANTLAPDKGLFPYSRGLDAFGMPGDYSSASRFVRATFALSATKPGCGKEAYLSRFFHIMDSVSVPLGCVVAENGLDVSTLYTSAMDLNNKVYYFTTYGARHIRKVELLNTELDPERLSLFEMYSEECITDAPSAMDMSQF